MAIPIKLYSASQSKSARFNMLDPSDKSRVKQQYVNASSGETESAMNWEAITAIVEIVGAIAIVITLAYLAVQIRQNSATVKLPAPARRGLISF